MLKGLAGGARRAHSRLRPFARIAAFAASAFFMFGGCARTELPGIPGLSPEELRFVRALQASDAPHGALWPGFSALFMPVLVHFEREPVSGVGLSVLLAHPAPPAGFAAAGESLSIRADAPPPVRAWFRVAEIGGRRTYVYRVRGASDCLTELQMFVHELFHVFQEQEGWSAGRRIGPPSRSVGADPGARADARIEQALLARALRDSGTPEESARAFSSLRAARRAGGPQEDASWEDEQEALEGGASYVEARFFAERTLGLPPGSASVRNLIIKKLLGDSYGVGTEFKWRYYGSGAAQGLLLDWAGVDWRRRVASGASLFQVFLERFPADDSSAQAIREAHNHASLVRAAKETLEEERLYRSRLTQAFEEGRSLRLHLAFPSGSRVPTLYGAQVGLPLDFGGYDFAVLSTWTEASGEDRLALGFRGVPVALKSTPSPALLAVLGREPRLELDGRPSAAPGTPRRFATLLIESPGVALKTERPGTLVRDGRTLRVRFDPEPSR